MLANELARYNVDIAALSETRREEEGELNERGAGYTFFWKGKAAGEPRQAGVSFAIKNSLLSQLDSLPKMVSERLMLLRLQLTGGRCATLISAYAPTMTNEEEEKERFYQQLHSIILSVPITDKLIILGDFNARVGKDTKIWNKVIGRHGMGSTNSNGTMLLSLCAEHKLVISNTTFDQPESHIGSWQHPRSKRWHLIDYVITRQRDQRDVSIARAYRGADCDTDHKLIRARVSFTIEPRHQNQTKAPKTKKLNVEALKDPAVRDALELALQAIDASTADADTCWDDIKTHTTAAAAEVLGPKRKREQADWFDENEHVIQPLLLRKQQALKSTLNNSNSYECKTDLCKAKGDLQREIRRVKNDWLEAKAQQIQLLADKRDIQAFYVAVNEVYGPTSSGAMPIRSKDGQTLYTDKKAISERWREHFTELLNCPSLVDEQAIDQLEQLPIITELDLQPSLDEVQRAIKQTRTGKAPGCDGIPAEIYRHGGIHLAKELSKLFKIIWESELVPQDLKDASIVTIFKRKGDRSECGNHRGISLLSIAGKILARLMLNRLLEHIVDSVLPESQCGFRANRGTIDMIFAGRQIQEKCREQKRDLLIMFIDLTKAFDTVNRQALWRILSKCGCPEKFINIVKQLHDDMVGSVSVHGETTEKFGITTGVKQGCVLAPTLFGLFFAVMIRDVVNEIDEKHQDGILIRFRHDGRIFHLSDLKAKTKTRTEFINELLYADDCALLSHTAEGLQRSANIFAAACKRFGLTISIKKTEVMFQPAAAKASRVEPEIEVNGCKLNVVNQFTYLGSIMSDDCKIDKEIEARIKKASASYGRLTDRVWENRSVKLKTKIAVYKAVVMSTLLYGCETWTCHQRHVRMLDRFHLRHLRFILRIKWQDLVPNTEVLSRCEMPGIESFLFRHRLRWAGHLMRMDEERLPRKIFLSELDDGARSIGRPLLRYKDTVKQAMKKCEIPLDALDKQSSYHDNGIEPTTKRNFWRASINNGVERFEKKRTEVVKAKRETRKKRQNERRGGQQQQHLQTVSTTHPYEQLHLDQEQSEPPSGNVNAVVADDGPFKCDHCASLGYHETFGTQRGLKTHARVSKRHKK